MSSNAPLQPFIVLHRKPTALATETPEVLPVLARSREDAAELATKDAPGDTILVVLSPTDAAAYQARLKEVEKAKLDILPRDMK